MPIIATAGHVDHGKSTLVEALTGRDPDRWAEEKARGLTIDLGFAWADLGASEPVGFVDVPGHERFIKNMLAGIGAVDVALFVVGADEGWMPQSEEHAAVLDGLDVQHGVIALTRSDLVDDETLELAHLDVMEHTEGMRMHDWPIVAVSAVAGTGMAELREVLASTLAAAGPPVDVGRPRLWIDRSFLISGAGLVVTGTLVGGSIRPGDELALWPGPMPVRVRGIQRHETQAEVAVPGTRTAVNLTGTDRETVVRGALLAGPGEIRGTTRLIVELRTVRAIPEPLTDRGAYQLHLGTGAWPARIRLLESPELLGSGFSLLQLDDAAPASVGDRFVLRETGRRAVVAGGRVLDPAPPRSRGAMTAAARIMQPTVNGSPDERATGLLEVRGIDALEALAADSGGGHPVGALISDGSAVAESHRAHLVTQITKVVDDFHATNPLRSGMSRAALGTTVGVTPGLLATLVATTPALVDEGATIRAATFSGGRIEDGQWADARTTLETAGLAAPRAATLGLNREVIHSLVRAGQLIKVDDDLLYLPRHIDEIVARLADLPNEFTVADFRDALGMSRRQAVPLLEYLDKAGATRRRGNVRSLRSRR